MGKKIIILISIEIFFSLFIPSIVKASNVYVNEEFGINIKGPEGWFMISSEKEEQFFKKAVKESVERTNKEEAINSVERNVLDETADRYFKRQQRLVSFRKYSTSETYLSKNPMIAIDVKDISYKPEIGSSMDYANYLVEGNRSSTTFKLVEAPNEIILNGNTGARYIYEIGSNTRKLSYFFFLPNRKICSLTFGANTQEFDTLLLEIQEVMNSFTINKME